MADTVSNPLNMPAEYMVGVQSAQQKQALAQALLKQTMDYKGTPDTGRRIVAKTPLSHALMNSAIGALAGKTASNAGADMAAQQGQYQQAGNAEVQRILSLPEEQQTAAAMGSKFPQAQSLAKALQERDKAKATNMEARLGHYGTALSKRDPTAAASAIASGKMDPGYTPQPLPAPQVSQVQTPQGMRPMVTNTNAMGEQHGTIAGGGVTVTNQMPGDNKIGVQALEGDLKPRQEAAAAAKSIYSATTRAVDALERGAQAGGGQDIKQNVRMALQAFGVNAPDTAQTAELGMALGNALLTEAAKIKPISNTDIETLRGIVGSIGTDPTALARSLAYSQAIALDGLGNYSKWLQTQEGTITDPIAKQRLAGSGIGYEMPGNLSGPTQHQLEVMRQMQTFGGDITRFKDPTGAQFQQGSKFNINPTGGYPVGQQQGLKVKRTGKDASGRKVEEMEDGSIRYAN